MYEYQTDFTRICRMIANKTRLTILWLLFDQDQDVQETATKSGISPQHASKILSSMAARGLLFPERNNRRVIYRPRLQGPQDLLLSALQKEKIRKTSHTDMIAQATAFTHERRIQIARILSTAPRTFEELQNLTGMTSQTQKRHLEKLIRRGVIFKKAELYSLQKPFSPLAEHLLSLAVR